MNLYSTLSKVSFLKKSYPRKFLFVAFLGIHIPLIGLIATIVFSNSQFSHLAIILFTLILTLVATLITLYVIHKLIKPINWASNALINYRINRTVPQLPMLFQDEAGLLLANIQNTIIENETYLVQKQDLIYLLTHDIKNFAAQPIGLANLILEEQDDTEAVKQYANLIIESTNKQVAFLEGFITLLNEEDEIANAQITKKGISIQSVIQSVQQEVAQKLRDKNITLIVNSKIDQVVLYSNEILLTRVIFNLIFNAIKFSHPNDTIELTVEQSDGFLKIMVKDNGIGFDNSKKQYLFDKFTFMGRAGTNKEVSTGIGLYLCNQIIKRCNGAIDAFSEGENKGATFIIKLNQYSE